VARSVSRRAATNALERVNAALTVKELARPSGVAPIAHAAASETRPSRACRAGWRSSLHGLSRNREGCRCGRAVDETDEPTGIKRFDLLAKQLISSRAYSRAGCGAERTRAIARTWILRVDLFSSIWPKPNRRLRTRSRKVNARLALGQIVAKGRERWRRRHLSHGAAREIVTISAQIGIMDRIGARDRRILTKLEVVLRPEPLRTRLAHGGSPERETEPEGYSRGAAMELPGETVIAFFSSLRRGRRTAHGRYAEQLWACCGSPCDCGSSAVRPRRVIEELQAVSQPRRE